MHPVHMRILNNGLKALYVYQDNNIAISIYVYAHYKPYSKPPNGVPWI